MKSKVLTILLSVVIAFGLWAYVITYEYTQIEYTFYNVEVQMLGESVLQDRGLMIASDTEHTVDLTLSGKRSDISKLRSSDITVLVDLTTIHEAGEKVLSYEVSFPGDVQNSAIEIVKRQPASIELTVALWETKEIPIHVETVGTPAHSYKIDGQNISVSHETVNISGPKELLDKIEMGKLTVNMDGAKESFEQRQKLTLCGSDGEPVDENLSKVTVATSMILVKVPVLMEKEISLRLPVVPGGGLTAEDVKLTMSFDKITVSGSPAVVSKMADFIELEPIDLSVETQSFSNREYSFTLPSGVKSREGQVVDVSLDLPETSTQIIRVPRSQFEAVGLPEGYEVNFTTNYIDIVLQGKRATWGSFDESSVRVIVDVSDLVEKMGDSERGECPVQVVVENNPDVGAIEDPDDPYIIYVMVSRGTGGTNGSAGSGTGNQ